ncbi:sensor histidine kinase [Allokutzneria oryzae]|uniref:histidine kinase n=1 Tax=Allokutzneria oryzae TaxID=1378989 RepID=A0ABV5ZVV2_9PSEU
MRISAVRHWTRLSPWARDAVLAVAVAVVVLGMPALDSAFVAFARPGEPHRDWLWVALVLATSAPLALSRRFPIASVAVVAVITLWSVVIEHNIAPWAVMAGAFAAACHCDRSRLPLLAVGSVAWMYAMAAVVGGRLLPSDMIGAAGLALMPVSLGYALRVQREHAIQLQRLHVAEQQRARAEERARVARDVHDVAGHHLSAIRLRAMGASRAKSASHDEALSTVAELSANALSEIRGLIGALREDEPRLTGLPELAQRLSSPELRITVTIDELPALPERLHGCGYRIAQEALTNVVRHSGAKAASVHVEVIEAQLIIIVEDDGAGADTVREGNGLRGMRERAEQLGGTVVAGPLRPRGWRVTATLPVKRGLG